MFFSLASSGFTGPDFLALLKARDESALQSLVKTYLPQILRAAKGAGLNPQNSEDVCQSTFVTFIEKIDEFEGRSHVRTWLFGILYRKISEMRRLAQREATGEDIEEVMETRFKTDGHWQSPPRGADQAAYEQEVREHLTDCLEGLTTDQRIAFTLREVEELDSGEICETLSISRSNLGVLLFRGRNLLRECLEKRNIRG
jgi:RNA polymerase sigma-70 factor (ECF subfamily)